VLITLIRSLKNSFSRELMSTREIFYLKRFIFALHALHLPEKKYDTFAN
jgi:hypothetical protein